MTPAEAAQFGWVAAVPVVGFVMLLAVFLLGMALLKEITR